MKIFFNILLITLSLKAFSVNAEDCQETIGSCDFYQCRESLKSCGEKGYYSGFASKYCKKSQDELSLKMSVAGKIWITKVTLCLQKSTAEIPVESSCKEVFNKAVDDHSVCYVESGFCALPFKDKYQIIKMLKKEFIHSKIILEGLQVIDECVKQ